MLRRDIVLLAIVALACVVCVAAKPQPPAVTPENNLARRINFLMADSMNLPASTPFGRINAISFAAIHDTINLIQKVYKPLYKHDKLRGSDKDANVKAAMLGALNATRHYGLNHIPDGYDASVLLPPSTYALQFTQLNTFITSELNSLRTAPGAKQNEITIGFQVGSRIGGRFNEIRENDGYRVPIPNVAPACGVKGQWCPSFDGAKPVGRKGVSYANYAYMTPFSYDNVEDLLLPRPVEIESNLWWHSYNTTRMFGYQGTPYSSQALVNEAKVWATGPSIQLMGYFMDEYYRVQRLTHSEYDATAMFASMYVINQDAGIHLNWNKYYYLAWRPYHAVAYEEAASGADVNTFKANVDVHNNPEYPCGQCEGTTSSAKAVSIFLGVDEFPLPQGVKLIVPTTLISPEFHSFSQISEGVARGRIVGGVHWPFSTQIGVLYGTKIAVQSELFKKA